MFDLGESELQIVSFDWRASDGMYVVARESSSPFQRNQYRLRNQFRLAPSFAQQLDDAGEPYLHPRKSPVCLSDLYVYPEIKERSYERVGVEAEKVIKTSLNTFSIERRC